MKKQKTEKQNADEILQQLQKSYLDASSDLPPEPAKEDADEVAFSQKLAALLKRFTGGKESKKAAKRKKNEVSEPIAQPEPGSPVGKDPEPMEKTEPEPPAEEASVPVPEIEPERKSKPVKPKKPHKPKAKKIISEPIVAEEPTPKEPPEPIAEKESKPAAEPEPIPEEEPEWIPEEEPEPIPEEEPEPIPEEEPEPTAETEPAFLSEEPEPEPPVGKEPASTVREIASAAPVVIRPKQSGQVRQRPIVIKPRDAVTSSEEPISEPVSSGRIRIGKKATPQPEPWGPPRVQPRGGISRPPIRSGTRGKQENEESKQFTENENVKQSSTKPTAKPVPPKKQPSPKRVQKQNSAPVREVPENAAARDSGLNENDVAMIFELGYENELGRLVGFDALKKIKSEHARHTHTAQNTPYETAFGYRGEEYTGREMRDRVLAAYLHDRKNLILRLIATVVCIFALLMTDLPQWFGPFVASAAVAHPYLFAGAGTLLLCLTAAIHLRRLLAGARGLLRFMPTPYTPVTLLFPLILFYDIIRIFNAKGGHMPALNLCAGGALLFCLLCDCVRLGNEMRTFRLLSGEEQKTVLEPTDPGKKMMRQGSRTVKIINDDIAEQLYRVVKIINDDIAEQLYRVRPAKEVTGFFRRSNEMSSSARPITLFLILSLSLSLIAGVVGAVLSGNVQTALTAAALTFLLTLPGAITLLSFAPLNTANRKLTAKGCALIGEESVAEFSHPGTLIFDDTDLFAARRTAQASLRQSDDFRQDIRLCEILFRKIDGTLGAIGRAKSDGANDPPVLLLRIEDHGVEALIDGKARILAGNADFLSQYGLSVPRESTDRLLRRPPNTTLLYVAIDGLLKLHYEIVYQPDPRFEELARLLAECDMTAAVHTYDPNLCDAFLQSVRDPDAPPIRVIKPGRYEDPAPLEISDTGVISIAGRAALVAPVRAACAIRRLRTAGYRMLLAALLPSAALAVCGALLLPASALPYLSLLAVGWRGLWDLACYSLHAGFLKSEALFGGIAERPGRVEPD